METLTTRKFENKKKGILSESEVRLTTTELDKADFLAKAEGSRWLTTVGVENVVEVRQVVVHWRNWYSNEYVAGQEHTFFEVQTKTGVACFLSPENDPVAFMGRTIMASGVVRKWKGRCGYMMPWLRAQVNPSGRKSCINTDSVKTVPDVCMARIYNAMNPECYKGYATV